MSTDLTAQQDQIRTALDDLRALLDEAIPANTIHWAVTDLRVSIRRVIRLAHEVHTHDYRQTEEKS